MQREKWERDERTRSWQRESNTLSDMLQKVRREGVLLPFPGHCGCIVHLPYGK
jgi:hypothetical protein